MCVAARVVQMAAGREHTTVLTSDGEVRTFGRGLDGQLGHGRLDDELAPRSLRALGVRRQAALRAAARLDHAPQPTPGRALGRRRRLPERLQRPRHLR